MLIMGDERASQIVLCLKAALLLLLNESEAHLIVINQIKMIKDQ